MSLTLELGGKCFWCGEPFDLSFREIWEPGHEFMLDACCEGAYNEALEVLNGDPDEARDLLRELGAEHYTGHKLRRCADNDGQFLLDYCLEIKPIERDQARAFIAKHHEHNKPPVSWRYGAGIWNGGLLIGVVMVGRPVARMIDGKTVVEVNRLCVDRGLPDVLRWNACSQLYGWAAREAAKRGFAKIITYTLESEAGTTLKAVGWTAAARTKGGSWNRPSRERGDVAPLCRKIRWERRLAA